MFYNLLKHSFVITLAPLMLLSTPSLSEEGIEGLGRLFIEPEQREKLESVRRGTYNAEIEKESRVSNVRVDGIMVRSDGKNVVWVNGGSTLDGEPIEGVKVNADAASRDAYDIQVRIDGKNVKLKPGQNWSEGTGTVKDNY